MSRNLIKVFLSLLIILSFPFSIYSQSGQQSFIDSLNLQSESVRYSSPAQSASLAKKALLLSGNKKENRNQKVLAYVNWSYALLELAAVDSSSIIADSAKVNAIGIQDSAVRSAVLVMQGYLCDYEEKNEEALRFYFDGLALCPDLKHRGSIYNTIGTVYKTLKDLDNAEKYYRLGYEIGLKQNDLVRQARCLNNLGGVYYSRKDYAGALVQYNKALQAWSELKDPSGSRSSISNIAMIYEKENKLDSALLLYQKSLELSFASNRPSEIVIAHINIGNVLFKLKKEKQAFDELDLATKLADSLHIHYYSRMAHRSLAHFYAETGKYKDAYDNYVLYSSYNDSVLNENMQEKTKELELRYRTRESAQQIKLLNEQKKAGDLENENKANQIGRQRNMLLLVILISVAVILLAGLLFQRYRAERKHADQLQKLVSEKDLLLREIHHRVKNNLQLVSSLLSLQDAHSAGNAAEALKQNQERIHTLSLLHEQLYRSADLKAIGFREYVLQLLEHIAASFSKPDSEIKLDCEADDVHFDIDQLVPCGLILNELVTNSFKYAFPNGKGQIKVELKSSGSECILSVSDNGTGFDTRLMKEKKTLGLRLVEGLCRQLRGKFDAESVPGKTSFKIVFPLKQNSK